MKKIIEVIAKALVSNPEQVVVTEKNDSNIIVYELSVASEDMGKVIGKQGRIAKALRTVVKAAAEAIEQACKYAALWLGLDDSEIRFTVPLEFAQDIDPQILAQLSNLMLAGKVSSETVWSYLQTGKIPERDFEAEQDLIEEDQARMPLSGNTSSNV